MSSEESQTNNAAADHDDVIKVEMESSTTLVVVNSDWRQH